MLCDLCAAPQGCADGTGPSARHLGSPGHPPEGAGDASLVADAHSIVETLSITAGAPLDAVPRHTRVGGRRLGEDAPWATPSTTYKLALRPACIANAR